MPENFSPESDFYNEPDAYPGEFSELDPISSVLSDCRDVALNVSTEGAPTDIYRGLEGRRRKAAVTLTLVWSGTIALHLFSWGYWLILFLTSILCLHALRIVAARPALAPHPLRDEETDDADLGDLRSGLESLNSLAEQLPYISLLVAAKNEEAVVGNLVRMLCNLDYPLDRYDLWVIDDNSTDRTPGLLDKLAQDYNQLQVIHRSAGAGGGKSGALNQVLPLTKGDIVAVFDADAVVSPDLLRCVLPLFDRATVGAVQVRKAILNADTNFWTRGQMAEMALDTFLQQQRIAIGGIGELRGNGQFVRRTALQSCGGWNEETITDDLDLTLRLHLAHWDIDCLAFPAVGEEGVTTALSLWHQRNRWAEGGYQRYLDYWRLIALNRMGLAKTLDMLIFWLIQYLLPTATVPDFVMAVLLHRLPLLSPITSLGLALSFVGMFTGLRRIRAQQAGDRETQNPIKTPASFSRLSSDLLIVLLQTLRGTFYMLHWLVVVATTTARISVRPKRLKWVKTVHQGTDENLAIEN